MDVFKDLENEYFANSNSKTDVVTILNCDKVLPEIKTQVLDNNGKETEENNELNRCEIGNTDIYEEHTRQLITQKFELTADDELENRPSNQSQHTNKFLSAIQRVKMRMQKKNVANTHKTKESQILNQNEKLLKQDELKESDQAELHEEKKDSENKTSQALESETISTKPLNNEPSDGSADSSDDMKNHNDSLNDYKKIEDDNDKMENDSDDDDDDDDDDMIRVPKRTKVFDESDNDRKIDNINLKTQDLNNDNYDDSDNDEEEIKPTQKLKSSVPILSQDDDDRDELGNTQPTGLTKTVHNTELNSLFGADDYHEELDELASRIEGYEKMSSKQRLLARKLERSKIRSFSRKEKDLFLQEHMEKKLKEEKRVTNRRLAAQKKKKDVQLQNLMITESIKQMAKVKSDKFTKNKLLDNLNNDSDNETSPEKSLIDQEQNSESIGTPPTSPQFNVKKSFDKPICRTISIVKAKSYEGKNIVSLSSDSESEKDNESDFGSDHDNVSSGISSNSKEAKMLDIKLFFSKKQKERKDKYSKKTLSDKIKKINAKQLKSCLPQKEKNPLLKNDLLTEDALIKMLHDEQHKSSELRAKKLKEEKRKRLQKLKLEKGEFPSHDDDDPEFSEYSSDFDITSDEDDKSENDIVETNNDPIADELLTNMDIETQTQTQNPVTDFKFSNTDALKEFNLTQLLDESVPNNKNNEKLTAYEKFNGLRGNVSVHDASQSYTNSTIQNSRYDETSFLTKQLRDGELEAEEKKYENHIQISTQSMKNILDSQNMILETQADSIIMSTQEVGTLKIDGMPAISTQTDSNQLPKMSYIVIESQPQIASKLEKNLVNEHKPNSLHETQQKEHDLDDDDDDDDDEKIKPARKLNPQQSGTGENGSDNERDDEEVNDEESEEIRLERAKLLKLARKKEREMKRQKEKEFKAKGLGEMMENEAVESEDEYNGIGGADGDMSDDENSEDEKIIDDVSNIRVDENEMRRIQLEKELKEDQEKVSRTYKDVKTHKLAERRAKEGVYGIDLSDDEEENDEMLKWREYIRKRKLKEMKEMMETNKVKISDNDPKKPFFDAMTVNLPSHISIYKDSFNNTQSDATSDNEEDKLLNILKHDNEAVFERPSLKRQKTSKSKYSFQDDDDFRFSSFKEQENERAKRELLSENSDNDEADDGSKELKLLKRKTSLKIGRKLEAVKISKIAGKEITTEFDETDSFNLLASESSSITASFKKSTEKKIKISANTGNIIKEVNVTTSTKTTTNSKAAVGRLTIADEIIPAMTNKKIIKGSGLHRLDKMLAKSRKVGIRSLKTRR